MKAKDVIQTKPLYSTNLNNGNVSLVARYASFRDKVTMSSQNGDHKHPNPHSYGTELYLPWILEAGSCYSRSGTWGSGQLGPLAASWEGPMLDPGIYAPTNDDSSACYNKALGRLNEKMRGGLDLAVDLAEANQTRQMLAAAHKAETWFAGIGVKNWANHWLQYKYGWMPLAMSVYGAAEELINHAELLSVARGSATLHRTRSGTRNLGNVDVDGVGDSTCHPVTSKYSCNIKNACLIEVSVGPPSSLSATSRWTSLNPASIAWELVPYSFVVDWFIDIGSYLRDCETSYLYNSRFRGGFISQLWVHDTDETIDFNHMTEPLFSTAVVKIKTKASRKCRSFTRSLLTSYPCPHLPMVETDLSWNRLVTAGALIAQQIDPRKAAKLAPTLSRIL